MAGKKQSKNNPDSKGKKMIGKMVTSDDCLNCKNKCSKGENYLKVFSIKLEGKGIFCSK